MIRIVQIQPFKNPEIVAEIVSIYQHSFGNAPWNEGYRCPVCEHVIPIGNANSATTCDACNTQGNLISMVPYWPTERVLCDFYKEMGKRDAGCFVAKDGEKTVGFAWGYKIEMSASMDVHLNAPGLHALRKGLLPYLDEVAVSLTYRQKGIGELLVRAFKCGQADQPILLRTKSDSPMSRLVTKMHGSVLLDISRERIIAEIPR